MKYVTLLALLSVSNVLAAEMVLGEREIDPGVRLTFEIAPKDVVIPTDLHLAENKTDVHIEVLAVWSASAPAGFPEDGFVGYLRVEARVTNERTGDSAEFVLTPHLNLVDSLHYAQNIKLPGPTDDLYEVTFRVGSARQALGLHFDWVDTYGSSLIDDQKFTFSGLALGPMANAYRR